MSFFRITRILERKERKNKRSGCEWVEFGKSNGFEVRGMCHESPRFRSLNGAEAHKADMERIYSGLIIPRSDRELAKAARLGLTVQA